METFQVRQSGYKKAPYDKSVWLKVAHASSLRFSVSGAFSKITFKMHQATAMLRKTYISVKEVSEIFHFENQFNFSRTFKQVFSVSPSVYHKQLRV